MVHTLPPWTTKWRMAKIFGQIDSGELAARLGSPSAQDRRGNVIYYDNFEGTALQWRAFKGGTGADAQITADKYWMGSQSCKLTTGDAANNFTYISKFFSLPQIARFGSECMLWLKDDECKFEMQLQGHTGSALIAAGIRYDASTDKLYYYDSAGNPVEFEDDISWKEDKQMWMLVKLVVDYSTGKYVRCIFGDTEYDLSSYSYKSTSGVADAYLEILLQLLVTDNNNRECNIDNVIITQNEP